MFDGVHGRNANYSDGVLRLNQGEQVRLPLHFNIKYFDESTGKNIDYKIESSCKVVIGIKSDLRLIDDLLAYEFTNVQDNRVELVMSSSDCMFLKSKCRYHLYAKLYDSDGGMLLSLIDDMIIEVY